MNFFNRQLFPCFEAAVFIPIFFAGESTDPMRVGVPKRSTARDLLFGFSDPAKVGIPKRGAAKSLRLPLSPTSARNSSLRLAARTALKCPMAQRGESVPA